MHICNVCSSHTYCMNQRALHIETASSREGYSVSLKKTCFLNGWGSKLKINTLFKLYNHNFIIHEILKIECLKLIEHNFVEKTSKLHCNTILNVNPRSAHQRHELKLLQISLENYGNYLGNYFSPEDCLLAYIVKAYALISVQYQNVIGHLVNSKRFNCRIGPPPF